MQNDNKPELNPELKPDETQTDAVVNQDGEDAPKQEHKLLELTEDENEVKAREERKKNLGKEVLSWVVLIAATLLVVFLIRSFVFEPIVVEGPSMNETLYTGDRVFVTKFDYLFGEPERGQVVICHYPDKTDNYIKRMIALPGDTLEIRQGVTYVNGEALNEDFIAHPKIEDFGPVTMGADEYFVMGDNRANSNDSRRVGPLSKSQIVGHVRYQFWPLNDMHTIEQEYTDYQG